MKKILKKKWSPLNYAESSHMQFRTSLELLEAIDLPNKGHLLDVGCGDGKITALIAKKNNNLHVTGADISSEMIKYANDNFSTINNLKFIEKDAHILNYKNTFSFIISFWALSWIVDHGALLNSIYNALSPRGAVFLLVPENNVYFYEACKDIESSIQWKSYFNNTYFHHNHASFALYKELINYYELCYLHVEKKKISYFFSSKEEMILHIQSWLPHLGYIPQEKHLPFVKQLLSNYRECMRYDNQNPNTVSFNCILVKGNKSKSL